MLAFQAGLKMVRVDNVLVVTTAEKAKLFNRGARFARRAAAHGSMTTRGRATHRGVAGALGRARAIAWVAAASLEDVWRRVVRSSSERAGRRSMLVVIIGIGITNPAREPGNSRSMMIISP